MILVLSPFLSLYVFIDGQSIFTSRTLASLVSKGDMCIKQVYSYACGHLISEWSGVHPHIDPDLCPEKRSAGPTRAIKSLCDHCQTIEEKVLRQEEDAARLREHEYQIHKAKEEFETFDRAREKQRCKKHSSCTLQ